MLQSQRHRDPCGKLSKHCGCVVRINHILTPEQLSEHKQERIRALKRKYRAQAAAAAGRVFIPKKYRTALHDAHVICFKQHHAEINAALKRLHDAHVKKYRLALRDRAKAKGIYWSNPVKQRDRVSRRKEQLPDSYVIQNLKAMGIQPSQVTPSLVSLKREAMHYRRLSNTIKATIKTQFKENK